MSIKKQVAHSMQPVSLFLSRLESYYFSPTIFKNSSWIEVSLFSSG